jgi:hypothetical protein
MESKFPALIRDSISGFNRYPSMVTFREVNNQAQARAGDCPIDTAAWPGLLPGRVRIYLYGFCLREGRRFSLGGLDANSLLASQIPADRFGLCFPDTIYT